MPKRTAKRPFLRDRGQLVDQFLDESGNQVTFTMRGVALGERLPAAEKKKLLAVLKEGAAPSPTFVLRGEKSPEHLEALLGALKAGDIGAPHALMTYLDDARVRPALLAAARATKPNAGRNHFQALGYTGGPGVRRLLDQRLSLLLDDAETFEDHSFFNDKAGALSTVAAAMLRLDRDATKAAQALVRLLTHPCGLNRRTAIRQMVEALTSFTDGWLRTDALELLRGAVDGLLDDRDPAAFIVAMPALVLTKKDQTLARARRLLNGKDAERRLGTAGALLAMPTHVGGLALLAEWAPRQNSTELVWLLGVAPFLIPASLREKLLSRGLAEEAPSKRFRSLRALQHLPAAARRRVARKALKTEPDPALRRALSKHLR